MTFEQAETSAAEGNKTFLYEWTRSATSYRYANADSDITALGSTYTKAAIEHEDNEQSGSIIRMSMPVRVPIALPVAQMYAVQSPMQAVTLTIYELHQTDSGDFTQARWTGRITTVLFEPEQERATITHEATYASMQRNGLRHPIQANCPYVLYSPECGVSRNAFVEAVSISPAQVNGLQISNNAFGAHPDGYWTGGYIEYILAGGIAETRGIVSHTSDTLTLNAVPAGLEGGGAINAYPGCDHTTGGNGCSKFNNVPNYGGFPNFARKNPFGADPIY